MSAERLKIGQPRVLTLVEVLDAHEVAIARHGGAAGVRDQGSLESALALTLVAIQRLADDMGYKW